MKRGPRLLGCILLSAVLLAATSNGHAGAQSESGQSGKSSTGSAKAKTTATGKLTATPNPIKVCDGSGMGVTTLSWTSTGAATLEIHVGKPDGKLFARGGAGGSSATNKWVNDGMVFYLQDASDQKALTAENTLATVTVGVTTQGCP